MSLQKICDNIEGKFPITIQVKRERRPAYAGYATYTHLVVVSGNKRVKSDEVLDEALLAWWLHGLVTGMNLEKGRNHEHHD